MYTLYIANKNYSSWSLRPWVLMQELNIPFHEELSVFSDGSNWDTFRTFSPNGLVPCLQHSDEIIWDSLAITEYLYENHPQVWPKSQKARAWARCASAEMHSGYLSLRNQCPMNCGVRIKLHQTTESLLKDIRRLDEIWKQGLSLFNGPFLAGKSLTAVDAFFAPVAFRIQTYNLPISDASAEYVKLLLSLDSMQEWYKSALLEPWREIGHEQESRDCGEIHTDFRN